MTAPRVLVVVGAGCVVLGGAVAAVTEPLQLHKGSWLAAYLVLVCGVAQFAMGQAPTRLRARPGTPELGWALVVCWNLGNSAVIGGTLTGFPVLVDIGSLLLVAGLVVAMYAVRPDRLAGPVSTSRLVGWAYRSLLLLLLVSIPVGVAIAHVRSAT